MTTHSAADSASGYLYQCRYALFGSLRRQNNDPGLEVSIECLDDVAFSTSGDPIELLQAKHSFSPKPISDMSTQLWKTIGIWTKHLLSHPSDLGKIRFTFLTTSTVPNESGLGFLRPSENFRNVAAACVKLEKAATASSNKEVAWATKLFLDQTPEFRGQILEMIEVLDGAPNLVDVGAEIAKTVRRACRPEHLPLFVQRLEGWWFGIVVDALATLGGKFIPVSLIDSKVDDLREEFGPEKLPIDYGMADPTETTVGLLESRPFVDQLRLVKIGPTGVKTAIVDYFRARQQRSRWSREGLLRPHELTDYGRKLSESWARRWGVLEGRISDDMADEQLIDHGRTLYEKTIEICVPLRDVSEPFISHGSYHILSDKGTIGWHPHFSTHIGLKSNKKDNDEHPLE